MTEEEHAERETSGGEPSLESLHGAAGEGIAELIFAALREIDEEAVTVRGGYPTGLRWLQGHLGRTGKDTTEDAISEQLAARLPRAAGVSAAATQVAYPTWSRRLADCVTRGTCDLVVETADVGSVWIEVKGAWPYLRSGRALRRNRSYRKHLVSPSEGAARDFLKLAPLLSKEAAAVGVLVLGFDIDEPDTPWHMADDDVAELEHAASVDAGGWCRHEVSWIDSHAHRVYADERSALCRTRCLLWLRGT